MEKVLDLLPCHGLNQAHACSICRVNNCPAVLSALALELLSAMRVCLAGTLDHALLASCECVKQKQRMSTGRPNFHAWQVALALCIHLLAVVIELPDRQGPPCLLLPACLLPPALPKTYVAAAVPSGAHLMSAAKDTQLGLVCYMAHALHQEWVTSARLQK